MNGAEQKSQPGTAPTLGWLVFGVALTLVAAYAMPDLISWAMSWRNP